MSIPAFTATLDYFHTTLTPIPPSSIPKWTAVLDYFHVAFTPPPAVVASTPVVTPDGATPGVLGTWTLYARDAQLNRVALVRVYSNSQMIDRWRDVGTWSISVPVVTSDANVEVAAPEVVAALSTPGAGVVVVCDGQIVFSGPATKIARTHDATTNSLDVSGVSDTIALADRLALPNPGDGRQIPGILRYTPAVDVVKTGVAGTPDPTNLWNDLASDTYSTAVVLLSVGASTPMVYMTRAATVSPSFFSGYKVDSLSVRVSGQSQIGTLVGAKLHINGVDYTAAMGGLGTSKTDLVATWTTNPATSLPWTAADIAHFSDRDSFGFYTTNSTGGGDIAVGLLALTIDGVAVNEFDHRSGVASSVLIAYVNANAGPGALGDRQVPNLVMAPDPLAGGQIVNYQAGYISLLQVAQDIATAHNLGFRIIQVDDHLEFQVYVSRDRTRAARFTPKWRTLTGWKSSLDAPQANAAYIGGQGTGVARTVVEDSDPVAVGTWGRRVEAFADRHDSNDVSQLTDTGTTTLAGFAAKTSLEVTPKDQTQMRYPTDWGVGDTVTVDADGTLILDVVTQVTVTFASSAPFDLAAQVGTPNVPDVLALLNILRRYGARLDNLEVNR